MLEERQEKIGSLVCVGLDPLPKKLPHCYIERMDGDDMNSAIELWLRDIVDATAPFASMFKPQKAHYEALRDGHNTLRFIVDYIHNTYPDIPVFLDCKRGDIGRTQQRYRIAHFEIDGVDGMNFPPYMGKSCMESLIDKKHPGRAIVGLCRTSNPEAWEMQDDIRKDGSRYWEYVAERILTWAQEFGWTQNFGITENAGLVMGAAHKASLLNGHIHHPGVSYDEKNIYSWHLFRGREIVGDKLWFLMPGIGTQGGFIEETVKTAYVGPGSIAINSSSGITFASQKDDFAEAAAMKAKELRDQINKYL